MKQLVLILFLAASPLAPIWAESTEFQEPNKEQREVLEKLIWGETEAALQQAVEFVRGQAKLMLSTDLNLPPANTPFPQESLSLPDFCAFLKVYELGETMLGKLRAPGDEPVAALVTELLGQKDEAKRRYAEILDREPQADALRVRLLFLQDPSKVGTEVERLSTQGLQLLAQRLQGRLQQTMEMPRRLDILQVLAPLIRATAAHPEIPLDWVPVWLSRAVNENYDNSRIPELYTRNNFNYGYNSSEEEARARQLSERRLAVHEAVCQAMLTHPRLGWHGFKPLAGLDLKKGGQPNPDLVAKAEALLPLVSQPLKASDQSFFNSAMRLPTPPEYLVLDAITQKSLSTRCGALATRMDKLGRADLAKFFREFQRLGEAKPDEFGSVGLEILQDLDASLSAEETLKLILGLAEKLGSTADKAPLIAARWAARPMDRFDYPDYSTQYADWVRAKHGNDGLKKWLTEMAEVMIAPAAQRPAYIAQHDRPGSGWMADSPSSRTQNYRLLLGQLMNEFRTVMPAWEIAEAEGLINQNDYEFSNNLRNMMQSYRIRQSSALTQFVEMLGQSPMAKNLPDFRVMRMGQYNRQTLVGQLAESFGELENSSRRQLKSGLESLPETFGRELLLGLLNSGQNKQQKVVGTLLKANLAGIKKLPFERQEEMAVLLQDMQGMRGDFSSAKPSNLDQEMEAWWNSLVEGQTASLLDRFLALKEPRPLLNTNNDLAFTLSGPLRKALASDPEKAERALRHAMELAKVKAEPEKGRYYDGASFLGQLASQLLQQNEPSPAPGGFLKVLGFGRKRAAAASIDAPAGFALAAASGPLATENFLEFNLKAVLENMPPAKWEETLRQAKAYGFEGGLPQPVLLSLFVGFTASQLDDWAAKNQGTEWKGVAAASRFANRLRVATQAKDRPVDEASALSKEAMALLADTSLPEPKRLFAATHLVEPLARLGAGDFVRQAIALREQARKNQANMPDDPSAIARALAALPKDEETKALASEFFASWIKSTQPYQLNNASSWQNQLTLAKEAGIDLVKLLEIASPLARNPDAFPFLIKQGSFEAAKRALRSHVTTAIPTARGSNGGRVVRYENGNRIEYYEGSGNGNQPRSVPYDKVLHEQVARFLESVSEPDQQHYIEIVFAVLPEANGSQEGVPTQAARISAAARKFRNVRHSSEFFAERSLALISSASGGSAANGMNRTMGIDGVMPKASAPGKIADADLELIWPMLGRMAKKIDFQAVNLWRNQELKSTRQAIFRAFLENGLTRDPAGFSERLAELLQSMKGDQEAMRQTLETYCADLPSRITSGLGSMTKEKAATYLPALLALCSLGPEVYWSQRSNSLHAALIMHVLAGRGEDLSRWLESLEPNQRQNVEYAVEPNSLMAMLRQGFEGASAQKRLELVSQVFGHPLMEQRSQQYDSMYQQLIGMNLLTQEEVLQHGPTWAEITPRNGAAYADLARIQSSAGRQEEALNSWIGAAALAQSDNHRYTQYAAEAGQAFLRLGRYEAGLDWVEFAKKGPINSDSDQIGFGRVERDLRKVYLTQPGKDREVLADCRARLEAREEDWTAWRDLARLFAVTSEALLEKEEKSQEAHTRLALSYFMAKAAMSKDMMESGQVAEILERLSDLEESLGHKAPTVNLIARNSIWKFHYADQPPPESWSTPEFDDQAWKQGPGSLGYGDNDETTVIPNKKNEKGERPITAYFRGAFSLDSHKIPEGLFVRMLHDDGMVMYLNGREVSRNNMPPGSVEPTTLASESRSEEIENDYWQTKIPATALVPGRNVVAVEIHQNKANSSDLGFDLELQTGGLDMEALWDRLDESKVKSSLGDLWPLLPEKFLARVAALRESAMH